VKTGCRGGQVSPRAVAPSGRKEAKVRILHLGVSCIKLYRQNEITYLLSSVYGSVTNNNGL
jgi:hypothetical protein